MCNVSVRAESRTARGLRRTESLRTVLDFARTDTLHTHSHLVNSIHNYLSTEKTTIKKRQVFSWRFTFYLINQLKLALKFLIVIVVAESTTIIGFSSVVVLLFFLITMLIGRCPTRYKCLGAAKRRRIKFQFSS